MQYQEYAMEKNDPTETSLATSTAAPALPKRRRAKAEGRQVKGRSDPRAANAAPDVSPAALRREVLRDALIASVEMLRRRRASDIPEGYIDDYVALNWLEWHGGGLRITTVGENICKQVTSRRACA
jgi:archaellum component FlaD/FlaE